MINYQMTNVFNLLGNPGNLLSGSKSMYRSMFPKNMILFNGNVYIGTSKVWWGDIDVTLSKSALSELSYIENANVYVLHEMDGRFDNETNPRIERAYIVFFPDGGFEIRDNLKDYYIV